MSPRELKYRQSQRYNTVMARQPRKPEFNWTCPNCGGSRNRPNFVDEKLPINFNGTQYWYPLSDLCKDHKPNKEDGVRYLLTRVR